MANWDKDQVVIDMQSPDLADHQPLSANKPPPKHNPSPRFTVPVTPSSATSMSPRPTLTRPPVSKPKFRFLERNPPALEPEIQPASENPKGSHGTDADSDSDDQYEDEEDEEQPISDKFLPESRRQRFGWRDLFEWFAFVAITACLVSTLTVPSLKTQRLWDLKLWKWCLTGLVVLCGRLVSGWLIWILVFVIERPFILHEKVLYLVYGIRNSVHSCVWVALVLLFWYLIFNHKVDTSPILHCLSRVLVAVLLAATISLLFVKFLVSSLHVVNFFDRLKESVIEHYILETLSGDPLLDGSGGDDKEEENEKKTKS